MTLRMNDRNENRIEPDLYRGYQGRIWDRNSDDEYDAMKDDEEIGPGYRARNEFANFDPFNNGW
jgi:hypothetical protein